MVAFAVSRENIPDVEVRQVKEVAEVLFVLIAIEASTWPTPVGFDLGLVGGEQWLCDFAGELLTVSNGEDFLLRRHLTLRDDVIDVRPALAI